MTDHLGLIKSFYNSYIAYCITNVVVLAGLLYWFNVILLKI